MHSSLSYIIFDILAVFKTLLYTFYVNDCARHELQLCGYFGRITVHGTDLMGYGNVHLYENLTIELKQS